MSKRTERGEKGTKKGERKHESDKDRERLTQRGVTKGKGREMECKDDKEIEGEQSKRVRGKTSMFASMMAGT